jgi:15-cis-phytoene desaturase
MITHAVVNRIPMAIPCPKPGTEAKRMPTVTALAGLLVAGDWTRTHLPACMESAVYSGWSAAEVILRARGRDEEWTLPVKRLDGFVGVINRVNRRRAFEGKTA